MLNLLMCVALLGTVTVEVEPAPKNTLPGVVTASSCDLARQRCREAFDSALCTMDEIQQTDLSVYTEVFRTTVVAQMNKGATVGQIGFYHAAIADLQLTLKDSEGAIKSFRKSQKYFIEADDILSDALQAIQSPKEDKTKGV